MPTNRNNNEVGKSFAIGTKIEYMNKLFEVTESNQCCDCSLATICSSSDISAGDRNDDALSRDKRINIFGECSSLRRPDSKSIVFVEIPNNKSKDDSKDNSKDEHYNIIPLWIDNNHTELKPVEFALPKGYVIDKEHSDLDKGIIKFKNKWLTLEQLYKNYKNREYHFAYRDCIKDFSNNKLVAIANLMDIASYFNRGWNYDFTKECVGYSIVYCKFAEEPHYSVREINNSGYTYYGNPVFKNEADAQYVIDNPNFRNILDKIFKG